MSSSIKSLPLHFQLCGLTADYIVALFQHFTHHLTNDNVAGKAFPAPPNHLDPTMAADCRAIADILGQAVQKKYRLAWDARQYAEDAPKVSPFRCARKDKLLHLYPPLIPAKDVIGREDHLPVIDEPAVITDSEDNALVWLLPGIIPPHHQHAILQMMEHVRPLLKTKAPSLGQGPKQYVKSWRTAPSFFSDGGDWGHGATLLYPAGFQQGQRRAAKGPSPSQDAGTQSASDWMRDFQVVGGLLDGILAVAHPALYQEAIRLMVKLFADHPASRVVVSQWPSCYFAVQIIANRETVRHRDISAAAGWLDFILTLGSYGEKAIMELHNLGASLSYDTGSVVLLSARLVVHGVPRVPTDRVCLAFYMDEDIFKWAEGTAVGFSKVGDDVIGR